MNNDKRQYSNMILTYFAIFCASANGYVYSNDKGHYDADIRRDLRQTQEVKLK